MQGTTAEVMSDITTEQVVSVQETWSADVVQIGQAYTTQEDYRRVSHAMALGSYFFADLNGQETKVENRSGYLLDENGELRISLHHSSLPMLHRNSTGKARCA